MQDKIAKKQLKEFGLLIGFGFPILIGWLVPTITGHGFRVWTLWIGIPSLILGFVKPRILYYPYKAWMVLGLSLGWLNSHIILGLVYLLVLQPIALILKLKSYDPLKRNKNNEESYKEVKIDHKTNLTKMF